MKLAGKRQLAMFDQDLVRGLWSGFFVFLEIAFSAGFVAPQEPQNQQQGSVSGSTLKVETDLVSFNVTMTDEHNQPVKGLKQGDFRVYEDGAEQAIQHFSDDDFPYALGLVLDRSGSMFAVIDDVYNAAFHTIRASKPDDEFFVVTFNEHVDLVQDFSSDRKVLQRSLKGVDAGGSTALNDAIYAGLKHLDRGKQDKKALLVVTDGADNSSSIRLRELFDCIREKHVTIYVVGFFGDMSPVSSSFSDTYEVDSLKKIAQMSGGKAYFPRSMKECDEDCIAIANELRKQYSLGYYPVNKNKDGTWREIRVELRPPLGETGKLSVRTREGYYAPAQ